MRINGVGLKMNTECGWVEVYVKMLVCVGYGNIENENKKESVLW